MSAIETMARPRRNRISVAVPKEYGSCAFQVILLPVASESPIPAHSAIRTKPERKNFVDALRDCPKVEGGESLAEDRRIWDVPSSFDRAGCFDGEDFA